MIVNHFFPETNFFINHPNFNEFLFDTKPYALVICRAVIREIDGLKHSEAESTETERSRSYNAREASRTIEAIEEGRLQLLNDGELRIYTRRVTSPGFSFDEEIEATAKRYANEFKHQKKAVIFLSSDRNLRILSRSTGSLIVADPVAWEAAKIQEQDYERRVEQAAQVDEQVGSTYRRRLSIEKKIESPHDRDATECIDELTARLAKAQELEHQELERFEEEQRVVEAEKDQQYRLANRNKYTLNLEDLRYGSVPKTFPVYKDDWTQIGEIMVQKYFTYIRYPDRIITIHLSARIAGRTFPLVVISATSRQLYKVNRKAYFIEPVEYKKVQFEEGDWKIVTIVDDLKITPSPITIPNGTIGQFPVFETLYFKIEALELTAEEKQEAKQRYTKRMKKERRKEIQVWTLIISAVLAGISACSS